ncbi:Non-specific serine/threonine protein kinase [Aphelenchoides bicaudatus]|nr:Non-specific serine/threonine protein kinase [Aphelenchoides bicaudatus]
MSNNSVQKIIAKYKSQRLFTLFRLDDVTSRHFLNIINKNCKLTEDQGLTPQDICNKIEIFMGENLSEFKDWRSFLCFLSTYILEVKELKLLRVICAIPTHEKQTMDLREMQSYEILYKILCYTCLQHGSPHIRWFFSVFGDEFFDQITGLILFDRTFTAKGLMNYLSVIAIALNPPVESFRGTENAATSDIPLVYQRPENLKDFLKEYSSYILPRLMFLPEIMSIVKEIIDIVAEKLEISKEDLIKNNFMYILDYHLLKAPSSIKLDSVIRTYCSDHLGNYYGHKGTINLFVAIFNLSNNEETATKVMEIIANCKNEQEYNKWLELKFLGVLLYIRNYVICDKHFLRRKKQFAAGFAKFLNIIDSKTLQQFAAKTFQTLWHVNSEVESFKECWLVMIQKLSHEFLIKYAGRILFYISQLNEFEEVATLFMKKLGTCKAGNDSAENIIAILQNCYDIKALRTEFKLNADKALNFVKESPHLCYDILPKILDELDKKANSVPERLNLLDDLLSLVNQLKCVEEIASVGSCMGKIGAISSVYLTNAENMKADRTAVKISSVGSHWLFEPKMFIDDFVSKCLSWFSNSDNRMQSDIIGFALQCVSEEVRKLPSNLKNALNKDLNCELTPFLTSKYDLTSVKTNKELPLINSVESHGEWIIEWFCKLSTFSKKPPFTLLNCLALSHCGDSNPAIFADFLPLLILCCLSDMSPEQMKTYITNEMIAVFSSVGKRFDVKDSCQFIFTFFSGVEKHLDALIKEKSLRSSLTDASRVKKIFDQLKETVMCAKTSTTDKFPASVTAAIACSNYYSALKILEEHVIEKDQSGKTIFERELFSLLEKLYYNINDVENTQGAYLHIINNAVPSASETILNLEVTGNIVEILPTIADSEENREIMSRCVLRLNQPELALAYVKHAFPGVEPAEMREHHPYAYAVFATCAMELGRWDLIKDQVDKVSSLNQWQPFDEPPKIAAEESPQTFPSHLASILTNCQDGNFELAKQYLNLAQTCATRSLFNINVEGGRPYSIGFEFVQQLHSLVDVQMAWPQLSISEVNEQKNDGRTIQINKNFSSLKELLEKWEKHDSNITSNHREKEPILSVRRNILRSLSLPEAELKFGLTHLLVQSCKLARNDDLPNLVLPFLTEAHKNGVSNIEIEEQRAFYYFESLAKSKKVLSIPTLNNAMAQFFPNCTAALRKHIDSKIAISSMNKVRANAAAPKNLPTFDTLQKDEEDCERYIESFVSLVGMAQIQHETCVDQILKMYEGLEQMQVKSGEFFYSYANFIDFAFKKHTMMSVRLMIRLCVAALDQGSSHVHELMSRIITVWLDTEIVNIDTETQPKIETITTDASQLVLGAFEKLKREIFYKAFPLLVSRLAKFSKKDRSIYNVMKKIMAGLLAEYPHQCTLLSVGECRSTEKHYEYRNKAMAEVYEMANSNNASFKAVSEAYKFIADQLMTIGARKSNSTTMDLTVPFGDFIRYFQMNVPPVKNRAHSAVKVPDKMHIPLFFAYMDEPFKRRTDQITIAQIEPKAQVIKSLAEPKRIGVRGSDGKVYHVLCKPKDELRRDARFMDLANILNKKSVTSKYTRNLGARIQTFRVIPLQERGGILEWVPNFNTLCDCISSLTNRSSELNNMETQFRSERDAKKKMELYKKLVDKNPLKLSQYLRNMSNDPASYYQIQRNYTISTAFMCSVGFIVGLGDRHTGNILVNQITGEVMHVDFCLLFNSGENLSVPERVPFRLTQNTVDGFGAIGIEGRFRFTMERSTSFIQQEKSAALACLKSFLHDPLIDWIVTEERKNHGDSITHNINRVESRLNGYWHTILYPKTGPFSVRKLVTKQIEQAMDEKILSGMFGGWSPWI